MVTPAAFSFLAILIVKDINAQMIVHCGFSCNQTGCYGSESKGKACVKKPERLPLYETQEVFIPGSQSDAQPATWMTSLPADEFGSTDIHPDSHEDIGEECYKTGVDKDKLRIRFPFKQGVLVTRVEFVNHGGAPLVKVGKGKEELLCQKMNPFQVNGRVRFDCGEEFVTAVLVDAEDTSVASHVCKLDVIGAVNLADGQPVGLSNQNNGDDLTDDKYEDTYRKNECIEMENSNNPWVVVELNDATTRVFEVRVHNPTDVWSALFPFEIWITPEGDLSKGFFEKTNGANQCGPRFTEATVPAANPVVVDCGDGAVGKFVWLRIFESSVVKLGICELQVFGRVEG